MKIPVTRNLGFLVLSFFSCQSDRFDVLYPIPTLVLEQGTANTFDLTVYKKRPSVRLEVGRHPGLEIHHHAGGDSFIIVPGESAPKLALIPLRSDGRRSHLIVRVKQRIAHRFTYTAGEREDRIVVMGGFNDWSRSALPMHDEDGDGVYERIVFLMETAPTRGLWRIQAFTLWPTFTGVMSQVSSKN